MSAQFDTTPDGIEQIIAAGESQTVEFKARLPQGGEIARILVSFANTEGGILLIGVSDNGEVSGIPGDYTTSTLYLLKRIASSVIPYPVESGLVDLHGINVVYAAIDKAPKHLSPVMTSRGQIYMRQGAQNIKAADEVFLWGLVERLNQQSVNQNEMVVFVAMSFREEEEPALVDYYSSMKRAVEATKLPIKLRRVDLVEGDYEISQHIMDEIDNADIIIADFTLNSRNVYFELGYARGTNKRIIQCARKGTELEFDIKSWRTLFYRNATELEQKLVPTLEAAYAEVNNDAV